MSGASTKPTCRERRDRSWEAFSITWSAEASAGAQLRVDGGGVPGARGRRAHEAVHVDAVALVGRHATRARVGVVEVAEGFEVGHDVAQGGRGDGSVEDTGQALRAHRLPGLDVELDEGAEDFLATFVQNGAVIVMLKVYVLSQGVLRRTSEPPLATPK